MQRSEPVKILVVDDAPEKVLGLEVILESLGQTIVKAYSGREALRCLLRDDFAVILLDVNMPEMDGFETAALIRQRKRSEQTPIIFVTALADERHVTKGYSLGAVDYIATPVDPDVLRAKVSVFVELYQKTESIRQQADHLVQLAREQAARQVAEDAMRRSLLLADASRTLSRSLDVRATVENLSRVVTPELADSCELLVCSAREDLQIARCKKMLEETNGSAAIPDVSDELLLEAGRACIRQGSARAIWDGRIIDPRETGIVAHSGHPPILVVPMVTRDAAVGALVLRRGVKDLPFSPADISLVEDIAGRAATALDNAHLYQKVCDGERRKDEFLAMLGHELRNPLAAITNAGELMSLLPPESDDFQEALVIVRQQAALMKRLVDDLLDVSRITSGRISLQKSVVDVCEVMNRVVEAVSAQLRAGDHTLHLGLPAQPVRVDADPYRLEQILSNLMVNAAKYMDRGGQVFFSAAVEDCEVVFRIRDTGIGISPELLPRVFDLFAQGDKSLHRSQGGLGIGLTIVRALTELHGGTVSAQSEGLGRGAEFVVRLPITIDAELAATADDSPIDVGEAAGRRVLVVEDQPAILQVTVALLRQLGYQVAGAANGMQALNVAREFRPDAMLLDIGLPEMDGYELARRVLDEYGDQAPLLIAMTGYGQHADRRRSLTAGFQHHLVKPVTLSALRAVLSQRLQSVSAAV
jgi:signal transduction histidine kinase/DNA-binding response OmpR family regulator